MVARETLGLIVVFGFGHDEIGDVAFLGLHGFNIKKYMQRRLVLLLRDGVCGSRLLRGGVGSSFGARASLLFPLSFPLVGLRFGGCLNKTTMRFAVHVLVAGGTVQVSALMFCNLV